MKRILIFLLLCSQCFGTYTIINSFNAGEMSPLLEGRTDLSKYYSGCRTLENCLVLSYGGAQRRPGTRFIAAAKNPDSKARLLSFEFSVEQAYPIEAGNLYMRFYKDSGQILSGNDPFEIVTPYLTADLFQLQFVQSADTMYLVHPEHAPRSLTRADHDDWTLATIEFERGPFLDQNTGDITITPSATTGSITLTASASLWNSNHIGAHWQITHTIATTNVSGTLANTDDDSTSVEVQLGRTFDFSTHGTWTGTVSLQRNYEDGEPNSWQDVRPVHYEGDGNITFTDTEIVDDALYRVFMIEGTGQTCNFNLTARSFDLDGVVEITAFTSDVSVTATVENTLGGTSAVKTWAEGAWSDDEGWPSAVAFYEERLVFAATTNSPQTIWFSQTGDWTNMLAGVNDSDAMIYTIAADQVNVIRWLMPQSSLLIGTVGGAWKISSSNLDEPLTPTNVSAKRQGSDGSAYIQPVMINNVILYVQSQSRKIRELVYSFDQDSWVAPDMTLLAEHITESGITEVAYQKTPDPTMWCVRNDGELAGMTYIRDQGVVGWHRQTTDGEIESVAVIPGDTEDEIWISVKREINGDDVRYIEQFQPRDWINQEDAFFVDSGLTFDGGAAINITDITSADPAVITALSHGFSDGEQVRISDVTGMTEVNNNVFSVSNPLANSFELRDLTDAVDANSIDFTEYISGGSVLQVENTFTTLNHLNGETLDIQGDGGFAGRETVASGIIVLDDFFNTVHAGLPYISRVKPMRLAFPSAGTIQGRVKRISETTLRFHETLGCKIGDSWTNFDPVIFRDAKDPLEQPTPLFSGDKRAPFVGSYETDGNIFIQQDLPLPFTLIAIIPEFEVER